MICPGKDKVIKMKRAISLICASLIMLSAVFGMTACSAGKKASSKKVEDDGKPWFDSEKKDFEVWEPEGGSYYYSDSVFPYGDGFAFIGDYTDDKTLMSQTHLVIYDSDLKIAEDKNLDELPTLKKFTGEDKGYNLDSRIKIGDSYLLRTYEFKKNGDYKSEDYLYDLLKDELKPFDIVDSETGSITSVMESSDGNYYILVALFTNDYPDYALKIYDGKKVTYTVDLSKEIKEEIYGYGDLKDQGDTVTFIAYGQDEFNITYDKASKGISTEEIAMEDYKEDYYYDMPLNGVNYQMKDDGFYIEGQDEPIFLFEGNNVSRASLMGAQLVSATDDSYGFVAANYGSYNSETYSYINVKRYDKNPNVGKELLKITSIGDLYSPVTMEDAIINFNHNSDKFYIATDYSYTIDYSDFYDIDWEADDSEVQYRNLNDQKQSDLVNQLAIDLMSGDAPDIVLGCSSYSQIQSEDYLLDMSSFISDELKDLDLFMGVINGSKVNDKLFYIPVTFGISGLFLPEKDAGDRIGFTLDEYLDVVDKVGNGFDPLSWEGESKLGYMSFLFENEVSRFIKDGKIDVNTPDFVKLADYVKENIEESAGGSEEAPMLFGYDTQNFIYTEIGDFQNYYNISNSSYSQNPGTKMKMVGVPGLEAHGPRIDVRTDIGISATTGSEEGCKEFLKSFFTKDILYSLAYDSYTIPISREVCIATVEDAKKIIKDDITIRAKYGDPSVKNLKLSDDDVNEFLDLIESSEVAPSYDPSISLIIREEIPAYFADQKSIEEVANNINDRAQTLLNEKA